jgi:hypothetical protein
MSQIHKALAVLETSALLIPRRWPMADGRWPDDQRPYFLSSSRSG